MNRFSASLAEAKYSYQEGPLTTGSCFDVDGNFVLNCQLFAHIILEELGLALPKWLRSAELYRRSAGRKVWVDKILQNSPLNNGDIFLFAPRPIQSIHDPLIYQIHIGVLIDSKTQQIAHASRYLTTGKKDPLGGRVYEQQLCDILQSPRYNTLIGIRRTKQ